MRVHKEIDIFIGDRVHSGAGRPKMFYDVTVETLRWLQYSESPPGASKVNSLWDLITIC